MASYDGFIPTRLYSPRCDYCEKADLTCCESTVKSSDKCEVCRVRKRPCHFKNGPKVVEKSKVWSHPERKLIGQEVPEFGSPTEAGTSGVSSGV